MVKPNAKLYVPNKKIVIASSFEGVFNNGVRECFFTSFKAYNSMIERGVLQDEPIFKSSMTPDEFNSRKDVRESYIVREFIALRPLVAVAEDYLTILQIIRRNTDMASLLLDPKNYHAYDFFIQEFAELKAQTAKERELFKKEFKVQREAQKKADYPAWLSLQEPFLGTLEQFRELAKLRIFDQQSHELVRGFELYYVTAKDEKSTYELCNFYGKFGHLTPAELGKITETAREAPKTTNQPVIGNLAEGAPLDRNSVEKAQQANEMAQKDWGRELLLHITNCIIKLEHIIGIETVNSGDTVVQMKKVAELESIPPAQVWRLDDRYDRDKVKELLAAGFVHQFVITGGYSFPWDLEAIHEENIQRVKDGKMPVTVVERETLAKKLSEIAKERGF